MIVLSNPITNRNEIIRVPDSAKIICVRFLRHHTADPSDWQDETHTLTWKLEQTSPSGWRFLGSSTTAGGLAYTEGGDEHKESWDETPLLPGTNRRVRITLSSNVGRVDSEGYIEWR